MGCLVVAVSHIGLFIAMKIVRQQDVTVIALESSYQSLDEDMLEEVGGLLLTHATTADPPLVVLDLSQTGFFGSTFIELLVRAWKRLKERGGQLALCGLQPFCAEVMQITQLDSLWGNYPTREAAVASITADKPT